MVKNSLLILLLAISPLLAMMEPVSKQIETLVHHGSKAKSFRILSIVGGSMRGCIPIEIVDMFENKTGKSISDSFNLITGTSAGGILALALTKPSFLNPELPMYSASYLKEHFLKPSSDFWSKNWFSFWGFLRPICDNTKMENILSTMLGKTPISQTTTGCMVTALDARSFVPRLFLKFPNPSIYGQTRDDYTRKDLAMATSAVPIYFKPYYFSSIDKKKSFLTIDGGPAMNDPSIDAFAVVSKILKNYKLEIPIEIVTLTCGYKVEPKKSIKSIEKLGTYGWASQYMDLFVGSDMKEKKGLLEFLDIKNTYLNVPIPSSDYFSFDSTAAQQQKLVDLTDDYLKNSSEFDALVNEYKYVNKMDLSDILGDTYKK